MTVVNMPYSKNKYATPWALNGHYYLWVEGTDNWGGRNYISSSKNGYAVRLTASEARHGGHGGWRGSGYGNVEWPGLWKINDTYTSDVNLKGPQGYLAIISSESRDELDFVLNHANQGTSINPLPGNQPSNPNSLGGGAWIDYGCEKCNANGKPDDNAIWWIGRPGFYQSPNLVGYSSQDYWKVPRSYIAEWGIHGKPEYKIDIATSINPNHSGTVTLSLDRFVRADYKNIDTGKALIDIPVSLSGNVRLGSDYTLSINGNIYGVNNNILGSHFDGSNSKLYILDDNKVDLKFTKIGSTYKPITNIRTTFSNDDTTWMGETIYAFKSGANKTQNIFLFDRTPQISLGQGAWRFIRVNSEKVEPLMQSSNNSILIFDEDGINETNTEFASLGLTDNFATRWETYIRIPEDGTYQFKTSTGKGTLTTKKLLINTGKETTREIFTGSKDLKQGDVIWTQLNYNKNSGKTNDATIRLLWTTPNATNVVVPASAMYLSEHVAKGYVEESVETAEDKKPLKGFQLFSTQQTGTPVSLQLSTGEEPEDNTTYQTKTAQRGTNSGSETGEDYELFDGKIEKYYYDGNEIGYNNSDGKLTWDLSPTTTDQTPLASLGSIKDINIDVKNDPYSELTETITLNLSESTGYILKDDQQDNSETSQSLNIIDKNAIQLNFSAVTDTSEGNWGWLSFNTEKEKKPEIPLWVKYIIDDSASTAGRNTDYLAPKATMSTEPDFYNPENYVILNKGDKEGKIYISALADTIREGDETVTISLVTGKQTTDTKFSYQSYILGENTEKTIVIKDDMKGGFGHSAQSATMSSDIEMKGKSPVGGVPLKMNTNGFDPYTFTYSGADWNITEAKKGETWTFSVYAKADRPTTGELFLFEANEGGSALVWKEAGISLNEKWQRYSITRQISDPLTSHIQIRLDGPTDDQATLWWDGIQVEKANKASAFTENSNTNHFAERFNPLDIYHSSPFNPALIITPKGRTGFSTIRSIINSEDKQKAYFDLHLASQPKNKVTIALAAPTGSNGQFSQSSVAFSLANWDKPQTITFTGQDSNQPTIISATSSSDDSYYDNLETSQTILPSSWPDDLVVTLWEGGEINPSLPIASIKPINDKESDNSQFGFKFILNETLPNDVTLYYRLNPGDGFNLTGSKADIQNLPIPIAEADGLTADQAAEELAVDGKYAITIPAGKASSTVNLIPTDDLIAEGNETTGGRATLRFETLSATLISDAKYSADVSSSEADAKLFDNDTAGVSFLVPTDSSITSGRQWTESSQIIVGESNNSETTENVTIIGLALSSQPSDDVIIKLDTNSYSNQDIEITNPNSADQATTPTLTFSSNNWNSPQTLHIEAVNNPFSEEDTSIFSTFNITSNDPFYENSKSNLSIKRIDNNEYIAATSLEGNSNSFTDYIRPFATLSSPSVSSLKESKGKSAEYTISLSRANDDMDTIVHYDLADNNSFELNSRILLESENNLQNSEGLALFFNKNLNQEAESIDLDGINETKQTFGDNNLTGNFSTTWSGYLYIPESGYYTFKTDVTGGTQLFIDGTSVIDEMHESENEWTSLQIKLDAGEYIPFKLDYQSFNEETPKLDLIWVRPNSTSNSSESYITETIPKEQFSRVAGHHLIIPAGETSASFSVTPINDFIKENDEAINFKILPTGVNLIQVESFITNDDGSTSLGLRLVDGYQESEELQAGFVLSLQTNNGEQAKYASFTFTKGATIHRDWSTDVSGTLTFGDTDAQPNSVIGMIGKETRTGGQYDLLERTVELIITNNLTPVTGSEDTFKVDLKLAETNHSEVKIPANTEFNYQLTDIDISITLTSDLQLLDANAKTYEANIQRSDSDPSNVTLPAGTRFAFKTAQDNDTILLILSKDLSLNSGQSKEDIAFQISSMEKDLDISALTTGANGTTNHQRSFSLSLKQDLSIGSDQTLNDIRVLASKATQGLDLTALNYSGLDLNLASQISIEGLQSNQYSADFKNPFDLKALDIAAGSKIKYNLPDIEVLLKLKSKLIESPDQDNAYTVNIQRIGDDQADLSLAQGTIFTYNLDNSGQTFSLTLTDDLVIPADENSKEATFQVSHIAGETDITSINPGLIVKTSLSHNFTLSLEEDLSIPAGETVSNVIFTAFNISEGLNLTEVDFTSLIPTPVLRSKYALPSISTLIIVDNDDVAGLIFSTDSNGQTPIEANSIISLSEDDPSAQTRYVQLSSQPTNSVTLFLETSDATRVLLQAGGDEADLGKDSRIALTFRPDNWDSPQSFNIYPVNDSIINSDNDISIHSRTNSSDLFYQETNDYNINKLEELPVSVEDNDQADVLVDIQQGSIDEAKNGFLNLRLTAEPTADVELSLTPSDKQFRLNELGIGQSDNITFTQQNWDIIQVVELHAVDDKSVEDITRSTLSINTSSADSSFTDLDVNPVRVDIVDNDKPTASIIPVTNATEEAQPGRFRIELSSPAPTSAGSKGVLVNYNITGLSVDTDKLSYLSKPSSINKITQSPGSVTGQVRIAPGQTSSDVFVVPIDDFVADSFDKSFSIGLVEGDGYGYVIDPDNLYNEATVEIINNDSPGIFILRSGNTLQVSENGDLAQFSVGLLSQPGGDVELTLTEKKINGRQQLGSTKDEEYTQTKTFTSSNWYIPQTYTVNAYDDFILEDKSHAGDWITFDENGKPILNIEGDKPLYSGLHPTQLQYEFSSPNDTDYDSQGKALSNLIIKDIENNDIENSYTGRLIQTSEPTSAETLAAGSIITAKTNEDDTVLITLDSTATFTANGAQTQTLDIDFHSDSALATKSLTLEKSVNSFTQTIQNIDVLDTKLPETTADSIQNSLVNLQEGIDSLALPIVGNLDGKTGGGLLKFITNLSNSIRDIGMPTPAKLSLLITEEINDAIGKEVADVSIKMDDTDAIVVGFNFSDAYDVLSIPLDASFGMPGLGLQSQGNLDATFNYDANLIFSFPRSGEPVLITSRENEADFTNLSANFTTNLSDDFSLTGGLGFLQLDAKNKESVNDNVQIAGENASTEMQVNFDLDLAGSEGAGADGELSLSELTSSQTKLKDLFQYEFTGDAAMSFGVETSVNGSAAIPSFSFDLAGLLPLFNYSNVEGAEEDQVTADLFFDNINLDLGSFITQMLDPIVGGIDDILNPLYPVVDALYADTEIFDSIGLTEAFDYDNDGIVSPIDLCSSVAEVVTFTNNKEGLALTNAITKTREFATRLQDVRGLIEDLDTMSAQGNYYVDFGSYTLSDFKAGEEVSGKSLDTDSTQNLNPDTASEANKGGTKAPDENQQSSSQVSEEHNSKFSQIMEKLDDLGFTIPLIDEPQNAINLLLGNTTDLFTWTMPGMGMTASIDKDFPIWGPIEGNINGDFGTEARIKFGFDTSGMSEWKDDGFLPENFWKVFNGFYIDDLDAEGNDTPEFTLDASMGAGLGLNARVVKANMSGGLMAAASLDLLDEGEIAGTSDGKIYGDEITSRISNPLDLFELVGNLSAYLEAQVQVGIDLGLISYWETVWEDKLAEIPIFEFGVGGSYGSGTTSQGYLTGSTVFFDANKNGQIDSIEPNMIIGDDSHFNLKVDHRSFDTNRNGTIDSSEGRLMVFGGTDTSTDLPFNLPMLGTLGEMVTPLTTLHTLALDLGYNEEQIKQRLQTYFNLGDFDYLTQDPYLAIQQSETIDAADQSGALATYTAHARLYTGLNIFNTALEKAARQTNQTHQEEINLLAAFTKSLFDQPEKLNNGNTAIHHAIRSIAEKLDKSQTGDDHKLIKGIADYAATASAYFGKQLSHKLKKFDNQEISPDVAIDRIHNFKERIQSHYQTQTQQLSAGIHKISKPNKQNREQVERLRSAHARFIPNASLTAKSIKSLTTESIKKFSLADVSVMHPKAIGAFYKDQLASIKPKAIEGLSKQQMKSIEPKAIAGLTSQHLKYLTSFELEALNPNQLKKIEPSSISGLKNSTLNQLDAELITIFSKKQIQSLSTKQLQNAKGFITGLSSSQIKAIDQGGIPSIKSKTLNQLDADQITAFSKEQIQKLSTQQIESANAFLTHLSSSHIKAIDQGGIPSIKSKTLNQLDADQITAFSKKQIQSLSKKQRKNADAFIAALTPKQMEALISTNNAECNNCSLTDSNTSVGDSILPDLDPLL